jgi:carboxyl-terminal processing protease
MLHHGSESSVVELPAACNPTCCGLPIPDIFHLIFSNQIGHLMCAPLFLTRIAIVTAFVGVVLLDADAQDVTFKREQAEIMAKEVAADVAKHYYDPKLHGVDWDAQLRETEKKIGNATSGNLAFANIAAMLDSLDDSHTFFIPPPRSFSMDYGWRLQTIGERCLVTHVRPQTDAATKVHPGDEVLAVNDYKPTRANIYRIGYVLNVLRPQSKIKVTVQSTASGVQSFEIVPRVFQGQLGSPTIGDMRMAGELEYKRLRLRVVSLNDDVLVARIPTFWFDQLEVDKLVTEARKHKSVILDLRGNRGGSEESLRLLASGFFDHDVRIADAVTRTGTKVIVAKPDRRNFSGRLTVLVDSWSLSAAEIFARIVQIEKRGLVLGDRTLGMVMGAQLYGHAAVATVFGVSVTMQDLIMSDGKSLEHVGVIPDEIVLPTADDLANERDPVLAHAAEIAGAKLSPKDAAQLFPFQWQTPYSFAGH